MVRQQFGAGDDARDAESGAPHRLRAVEGRVLKGRETDQPVDQARRQAGARDVDLVAQNRVDPLRQRSGNLRQWPFPRRRRAPRFVVFVIERQTQPDNAALPARFVGDVGRLGQGEAAQRREKRPLIGMGLESLVEKDAVAALPWTALQGQRDEIAEAARGYRVLAREEPVVRLEPDIRVALHRLGDQMGAETARESGGHRLGEEYPDMRAIARTRSLESRRHALRPAGFKESARVPSPVLLVEIGGEKPAGIVRKHGIDADRVAAPQMPVDRFVRHLPERLVGTGAALDARLAADAGRPLVSADRRIARFARPGIFPALRIDVFAAAKQGSEQRDLVACRRTAGDRPCGRAACPLSSPDPPRYRRDGTQGPPSRPQGAQAAFAYERGFLVVG